MPEDCREPMMFEDEIWNISDMSLEGLSPGELRDNLNRPIGLRVGLKAFSILVKFVSWN